MTGWANRQRFSVEVVTDSGRAAAVEFRFRLDMVEVWHVGRCAGVLDRDVLRDWLPEPASDLAVDEVVLSVDRLVDRDGRVAITLPDVASWTLSPDDQAELEARL